MLAVVSACMFARYVNCNVDLLGMALSTTCGKTFAARDVDNLHFMMETLPQTLIWDMKQPLDVLSKRPELNQRIFGRNINFHEYVYLYKLAMQSLVLLFYGLNVVAMMVWWDDTYMAIILTFLDLIVIRSFVKDEFSLLAYALLTHSASATPFVEFICMYMCLRAVSVLLLKRNQTCWTCNNLKLRIRLLQVQRIGGEMFQTSIVSIPPMLLLMCSMESVFAFSLYIASQQNIKFRLDFRQQTILEYAQTVQLTHRLLAKNHNMVFGKFCERDYFYFMFSFATQQRLRQRTVTATASYENHDDDEQVAVLPKSPRKRALRRTSAAYSLIHINTPLFQDEDFPPSNGIVFQDWDEDSEVLSEGEEFVAWLRPREIRLPGTEHESFTATQIKQGQVADCWLLSSLCCVALRPALLSRVLVCTDTYEHGRAVIRLFDMCTGEWELVVVDDRLPCDVETRLPLFACSRYTSDDQCGISAWPTFWMSLVEKAFAKRVGGYTKLDIGQVCDAMVQLTGGFTQTICIQTDVEVVETGAIWSMLRKGLAVLTSCSQVGLGLAPRHSYAVLDVGDGQLCLFDPWRGTAFWLTFSQVLTWFEWACICCTFSANDYCIRKAHGTWMQDWFHLKVSSDNSKEDGVVVYISLTNNTTAATNAVISLLVVNDGSTVNPTTATRLTISQVVASTVKYKDAREVTMEIKLNVNTTYILLPLIQNSSNSNSPQGTFRLSCYTQLTSSKNNKLRLTERRLK